MPRSLKESPLFFPLIVGFFGWLVPGAGHFVLKERKHAIIIFVTIVLTFMMGIYIGSIGVIDPVGAWPWYLAQMINSPMVAILGHLTAGGGYPVHGKPEEIGQIYTSISGLLNLLCIVNAVYLAYLRCTHPTGDQNVDN
jgi:hypothetical protein